MLIITCSPLKIFLGYFFSLVIGSYLTKLITDKLWSYVRQEMDPEVWEKKEEKYRPLPIIRRLHGIAESFLYTSFIVLGKPEGIGVWLAFKAIMRRIISENDPIHVPGSNIYMVGTIVSLSFGVIGGLIATCELCPGGIKCDCVR